MNIKAYILVALVAASVPYCVRADDTLCRTDSECAATPQCKADPACDGGPEPVYVEPTNPMGIIICEKPRYTTPDGKHVMVIMSCTGIKPDNSKAQSYGSHWAAEYRSM